MKVTNINDWLATEFMGWEKKTHEYSDGFWTGTSWRFVDSWLPTFNLQHAWEVVDKLRGSFDFHLSGETTTVANPRWTARLTPIHNGFSFEATAATPELAICYVVLKLRGEL